MAVLPYQFPEIHPVVGRVVDRALAAVALVLQVGDLHLDVVLPGDHILKQGDEIALVLGAANRDPAMWEAPGRFNPDRPIQTNMAFGAGRHFCIGAALARLELQIALQVLFESCPKLTLTEPPRYANIYHFHGLNRLMVQV